MRITVTSLIPAETLDIKYIAHIEMMNTAESQNITRGPSCAPLLRLSWQIAGWVVSLNEWVVDFSCQTPTFPLGV
jgi:hypothetical protein